VAEFLEKSVRAHDVCCRIGADEFAVILPDMARSACEYLVQRLRDKLAAISARAPFLIGLSLGTASYPEEGSTFDVLVCAAEDARYKDKHRQASDSSPHPERSRRKAPRRVPPHIPLGARRILRRPMDEL
jgi:diguanylate cyclase (GGDEF)-like protein